MLVYHTRSEPTGRNIAEALSLPHGFEVANDENPAFLIRWGSRRHERMDEEIERVINNSQSIARASDKLLSLELMSNAGIDVPAWSEEPMELVEQFGYPILGRDYQHARGSDIKLCLQERDFKTIKDFYTVYIPTRREFRIHVVGSEVVRVQAKYLDHPNQYIPWIRNYITGHRFRNPRLRLRPERLQSAISAVSTLGLDFGAVDLIIADDNCHYILEVNTAPSCSPLTGGAYVTGIAGLLDGYGIEINLNALNLLSSDMEDEDSDDYDDSEEE
jgi:glutathione synthase/RimK-type ligase-like ATP-grasp enzyme